MRQLQCEARRGAQRPGLGGADVDDIALLLGRDVAEYQAGHGEMKGADLVERDHGDSVRLHGWAPMDKAQS